MKPLFFRLDASEELERGLARLVSCDFARIERRSFPDGESYLRLLEPVRNRDVAILCTLDRPDQKTLPLLFAADAARQKGARSVGLIAPYLAYMRQDKEFQPGEAVTSQTFARLLSSSFDWLVTVDPHLHRLESLKIVYSIPATAVSSSRPIARWIEAQVRNPLLIGPDEESAQWIEQIAQHSAMRSAVLRKVRSGDLEVEINGSVRERPEGVVPVIVDDIASSARTMTEAVKFLRRRGFAPPVCVVVHPVFADEAYATLSASGPARIVSTNSIVHLTNAIDLSEEIAGTLASILETA